MDETETVLLRAANPLLDNDYEHLTVSETGSLLHPTGSTPELLQKDNPSRVHFPGGWDTATPHENKDGPICISRAFVSVSPGADTRKN